jgi:putative ABC transport system substrate-binding protein
VISRRRFFVVLSGVALAPPFSARAQPPPMPVVGFLNSQSPEERAPRTAAFHQGLNEAGFVEGRNVTIEYRWARNNLNRLPALAAELLRRPAAVIVASGGDVATHAAKRATATIPIVFIVGGDPVAYGIVASLNRPGGNATGVTMLAASLEGKRLELLHEVVPSAAVLAVLANPDTPRFNNDTEQVQAAAQKMGLRVHVLRARAESELEAAFATLVQRRAGALLVVSDPMFLSRRDRLVALAKLHSVPEIYNSNDYAVSGGLMSYGASSGDLYRKLGVLTGKILKGTKPADLPVEQPTKFELVVNMKTAKALGIKIPQSVLMRADRVIE